MIDLMDKELIQKKVKSNLKVGIKNIDWLFALPETDYMDSTGKFSSLPELINIMKNLITLDKNIKRIKCRIQHLYELKKLNNNIEEKKKEILYEMRLISEEDMEYSTSQLVETRRDFLRKFDDLKRKYYNEIRWLQ